MIKHKIIWDGEPLETRFDTKAEAEKFVSEMYQVCKDEVDEGRANDTDGTFWEDYPEYEIVPYETSVLKEWARDLRYSIDPYCTNPFDNIDPPFEDTNHPPCPYCNAEMTFYGHDDFGDFQLGEGYWKCPSCGFSIKENELDM